MQKSDPRQYIIFALDVPTANRALDLVHELEDEVGMFKVGLELFLEAGPDFVRYLTLEKGVKVFLDLKLHDIPVTVARAITRLGQLQVAMATVHCGENSRMLEAAVQAAGPRLKVLGVTLLTSIGGDDLQRAGFTQAYWRRPLELVMHRASMARNCGCSGVICSGHEVAEIKRAFGRRFLAITPGIRPETSGGADDQRRTVTPAQAVAAGADYIVVGRPIRDADDPRSAAKAISGQIGKVLGS